MNPYTQLFPKPESTGSPSPVSPPSASSSFSAQSPTLPRTSSRAVATAPGASKIRRRNRQITSCLECRSRKLKCDKTQPCVNCTKFRRECTFLAKDMDPVSQLKLTEIKEKVGSLERLLAKDAVHSISASSSHGESALSDDNEDDEPLGADDEKDLEPTPLAVSDAAYDESAEADDDLLDLGIRIGRMRMTERVGGFFRPKMAAELGFGLAQYSNQSSTRKDEHLPPNGEPFSPTADEYLKPGPSYIIPASSFLFAPGPPSALLFDFLPSRLAADRLIEQYFVAVHPICRIVHRPIFNMEYEAFWEALSSGIEPVASVQTVIFAAMFSGVVSMDEAIVLRDFGVPKTSLADNLKLGAETALGRANFLRTTKVRTLQGLTMFLIPMCREEVSRAHSVLVGAAVRMAECMGIHRDGETYGLNALETHVRRMIWYQLCLLDIRTCEAQGPKPSIRKNDFDTKLPLNVDDTDLHSSGRPPTAANCWTDATMALIRFECVEMQRSIWIDRPRIEQRKISLTAALGKIETFRRSMAAKYDHFIDERIPIQKAAKYMKLVLISKLYIMLLHRYHSSVTTPMRKRLRDMMLSAGVNMLEASMALETMPELSLWSWNVGAYHQYHVAFLLLMDVYFYSNSSSKAADRIWPCLDYVFQTDGVLLTRTEKARKVLEELHHKTTVYQQRRKMRAPLSMHKHLEQRPPREVEADEDTSVSTRQPSDKAAATGADVQSVGRAALPDVVYAGVSNGEALWAMPPLVNGSPSMSSSAASMDGMAQTERPEGNGPFDDIMAEIDWDTFDAMFPPDQMSMDWEIPDFPGVNSA
ncbi:MAG: hypothetical protein M1818_001444 [Claussenomyces sp. TS43310]|nr:MAG: hypothetical protein M1818_001444 [Claussenomyces sp. TS43310]